MASPLLARPLRVVIVGGSVVGYSAAYHLMKAAPKGFLSVTVLEKDSSYKQSVRPRRWARHTRKHAHTHTYLHKHTHTHTHTHAHTETHLCSYCLA